MGFEDVEWALSVKVKPTQKLVLIALAHFRNADTGKCFPSQKQLSEVTGLAVSAVKRSLDVLDQEKVISRMKTKKGGYKSNDEYALNHEYEPRLEPAEGGASRRLSLQKVEPPEGSDRSLQKVDSKNPTGSNQQGIQPGSRAQRGTRIPHPFIVTPDMRQWARQETPAVDVDAATRMFVDHWRSATGRNATKLDWPATWRNWLRRDAERRRPSTPTRQMPADRLRATLELGNTQKAISA